VEPEPVIEPGLKVPVAPAGNPEIAKVVGLASPGTVVVVTAYATLLPATTVPELDPNAMEKSGVTVRVACVDCWKPPPDPVIENG
jgi:hypothetical protein